MKKVAAVMTALVLLIGCCAFGVSAEGFTFREISRSNNDHEMQVVWNYQEANDTDTIEEVLVGGKACTITFDEEKTLLVDISSLDSGVYSVVYEYMSGAQTQTVKAKDLVISGDAEVSLTARINDDGTVTVTAKNGSGVPVAGYPVSLTIGNMSGISGKTDKNGTYTSFIRLDYGAAVTYTGVGLNDGLVNYASTAPKTLVRQMQLTTAPSTMTTVPGETEPTTETTGTTDTTDTTDTTEVTTETTLPTTAPTLDPESIVTVIGAGTTAVKKNKIVVNASTDTGVLSLFGCTSESFAKKARLHIAEKDYVAMTGRNRNNMLMLNVLTSTEQVSAAQLDTALQQSEKLSKYGVDQRVWFTVDLSFLVLDKSGNAIPVSAMPLDSTYVVELPVPQSMKKCKELAVTMKDGNGLVVPQTVSVSDGTFKLEINSLESYTIVGLGRGNLGGGMSVWTIVLIVLGVLVLIAVVLILAFVLVMVLSRKKSKKAPKDEEDAPVIVIRDNDSDIYSGRTDLPDDK